MYRKKSGVLNVILSAAIVFSTVFAPLSAGAMANEGQYILGDGSGGGGGGASGSNKSGGAGGNGGGGDDAITGSVGNDVIFGDGSGGGAGCRSVGGSVNPRGGVGGGGNDTITGGAGNDIIFGDGFSGQDYLGWYPGNGGIGGGGAGGSGGIFGQPPGGGIGGIGGGGGGAGGSGLCIPGPTLITGVGNPGGNQSGSSGGAGGNSAIPNESGVAGLGGAAGVYAGGGGAGFGGASGGAGMNNSNGLAGANGDEAQHTYNDNTGSVYSYFTDAVLRSILVNNPNYGGGNDVIDGGSGNNNLFGLGGTNTFIVESADNASKTVIWDLKYGDKLLLKTNGELVSEILAESVLNGAAYGDFDGDSLFDDTKIMFNGNPIYVIDNILSNANNQGTGGVISPANSAPVVNLNDNIVFCDLDSGNGCGFGAGFVKDRDGDQDWDGGSLEVQIISNTETTDKLGFFEDPGFIAPAIEYTGTEATYNGAPFATLPAETPAGTNPPQKWITTGNDRLVVNFNSNASNELVKSMVNDLIFNSYVNGNGNRIISVKLTDKYGNSSADTVVVGSTTPAAAPVFTSASTDTTGEKVFVQFDKAMMVNLSGMQNQFSISINDVENSPVTVTNEDADAVLELNLAVPVTTGQAIQVSYTKGSVKALDTGVLESFAFRDVTNITAPAYTVPDAPINVTAVAGDGQATVSFDEPFNGDSPITGYIVTSSPGAITTTGSALSITVTGLTNGVEYTFAVKAVNAAGESPESGESNAVTPMAPQGGGDPTTPSTPSNSGGSGTNSTPVQTPKPNDLGVEILVNGKSQTAATATMTTVNNRSVLTFVLDDKKVEQKIEQEGNNSVVTIPVKKSADEVVGQLNGKIVKYMETKQAVLEIKTDKVTYTLPASQINIDSVSDKIGGQVDLKDITVNVKIAASPDETVKVVENTAKKNNFDVVLRPVDFNINCSYGSKRVEVLKFNGYVERMVAIPDGIDPNKITTGIVLNTDGTFSHVPTQVTAIGGRYYAKINSLTNSSYSVIWSPKTFTDVEKHWARDAVNDMGSRLVISGVGDGKFEPQRDITRAEFAAVVVQSLGLMRPGTGKNSFEDVAKGAWYYDAVSIANEYGIITGYGNGNFGPMDKITREQAMAIIAKAMKITGLSAELAAEEQEAVLASFKDSAVSSNYSKEGIAACVKAEVVKGRGNGLIAPRNNITRAEVAVIVRNLLQKSKLI